MRSLTLRKVKGLLRSHNLEIRSQPSRRGACPSVLWACAARFCSSNQSLMPPPCN